MTPRTPRLQRRRHHAAFLAPLLGALPLLAGGCGGNQPLPVVEPPGDENGRFCPLPLVFGQGEVRPVRVRIENRTDRPLMVFIDRCYHHTRMADVPPGRIRQPSLPERLVAFPEGLRFHAFDGDAGDHVGIFTVPVETRAVLHLVLDEEERADPDSLTTFLLSEDQRTEMAGTWALRTEEDGGWAALWADPGAGILTWSCVEDRRGVTLGTSDSFTGDAVRVRVRRDEGEWTSLGAWGVQRGIRDALVVPEARHDDLRRWFGGSGTVDLVTEDPDDPDGPDEGRRRRVHRFETEGLEEALEALGCWGVPERPGG